LLCLHVLILSLFVKIAWFQYLNCILEEFFCLIKQMLCKITWKPHDDHETVVASWVQDGSTLLKTVWSGYMCFYAPRARVISTEVMLSSVFSRVDPSCTQLATTVSWSSCGFHVILHSICLIKQKNSSKMQFRLICQI
jgi:hypothetical protein